MKDTNMTMSQGEAVFQAVSTVVPSFEGKVELNKAQLEEVHALVFMAFTNGATIHSKNPSPEALKKYIPGLVNNWLRKDPRLNGGTKYQAKNPGSRAGSQDETIRVMRQLLAQTDDLSSKAAIQKEIDKRLQELKPKAAPINPDILPESLRHLVK